MVFKITEVASFEFSEVLCVDLFLACSFLFSSFFLWLYLPPIDPLFMLTAWPSGPSFPLFIAAEATQGTMVRLERWSEH